LSDWVAPVAADPPLDVAPSDVASDLHAVSFIPSVDIIAAIPYANVLGLPANVHPIVHSVIAAQQSLSSSDRATFLKRDHASELRLGTVSALYIAGRLFIPSSAKALHTAYVSAVHDIVCASALDMVERLRNSVKVFWDSMFADAEAYRKSCGRCQHVAAGHRPVSVGRMQQFLYSAPNDTLFMDIYGPLVDCRRRNPLDLTGSEHVYRYLFTLSSLTATAGSLSFCLLLTSRLLQLLRRAPIGLRFLAVPLALFARTLMSFSVPPSYSRPVSMIPCLRTRTIRWGFLSALTPSWVTFFALWVATQFLSGSISSPLSRLGAILA